MSKGLTIGDRDRSGRLEITDTRWDSNGTLFVTVRDLAGGARNMTTGNPVRAMRRLARRALIEYYEGQTRSSRMVRDWNDGAGYHATFAVSRNN